MDIFTPLSQPLVRTFYFHPRSREQNRPLQKLLIVFSWNGLFLLVQALCNIDGAISFQALLQAFHSF